MNDLEKVVSHVTVLTERWLDLEKKFLLQQAQVNVLLDLACVPMAEMHGITRDGAAGVIAKSVREEYERLILLIGDSFPALAEAVDLDRQRPIE